MRYPPAAFYCILFELVRITYKLSLCPVYLLIIFLSSDIPPPIRPRAAPVIAPTAIITSVYSIPLVKYPNRKIALYKPITVDNFFLVPLPLQSLLLPLQDLLANHPPFRDF